MWRQRVRWAKGLLLIFKTRLKKIFAKLFSKDNKHRVSTYDLFINCLPITLVTFLLAILQTLLTFLSPCFGISLSEAFFGSGFSGSLLKDLIAPSGLLLTLLRNVVLTCLSTIIVAIMTFVVGHKRIKNVSFIKKIVFCLFYPFFVLTQYLIDLQALFTKSVEWKVIPHKDQTKIDHIS